MSDLLAHLNAKNAEMQAWIDANPGSWGTIFHTDIPHWNESGIFTAEDLDDYLDACFQREMQKSAWYGDEEFEMNAADRNYYDYVEQKWSQGEWPENADAHVEAYEAALKKYGVDYIAMIPTPYEVMANAAGFLEY